MMVNLFDQFTMDEDSSSEQLFGYSERYRGGGRVWCHAGVQWRIA